MDPSPALSCRVSVDRFGATIEAPPAELRRLADRLEESADRVVVALAGTATVVRVLTASPLLKVSVEGASSVVIEGNASAVDLVVDALRELADEVESTEVASIARHAHIEYHGEDDRWMSPASTPFIIVGDWPDDAEA